MEESDKYWVALAVDNSIPRPEPDEETGFLPMYFNASPVLVPADDGGDAVCVFSTEGKLMAYMNAARGAPEAAMLPATAVPLRGRDDFREFFALYPAASHVALDPVHGAPWPSPVTAEEFLDRLED